MRRRAFFAGSAAGGAGFLGGAGSLFAERDAGERNPVRLLIRLDASDPSRSSGEIPGTNFAFPVGYGREGFLAEGSSFAGGFSLLGEFAVNAILSRGLFEMTEELITESGKSRTWLRENLFTNMNSIDFDGDGRGGEYGESFIGLEPRNSAAKQPFHFGEYKGVFRWYSYAIHGTQDENRIGKRITGGCINVDAGALGKLVGEIAVGDRVRVEAAV